MCKREFLINTVNKAQSVVRIASTFSEDIDASHGRYVVDLKSILGVLSLSLDKPVVITIHTMDLERANDLFTKIEEAIK